MLVAAIWLKSIKMIDNKDDIQHRSLNQSDAFFHVLSLRLDDRCSTLESVYLY